MRLAFGCDQNFNWIKYMALNITRQQFTRRSLLIASMSIPIALSAEAQEMQSLPDGETARAGSLTAKLVLPTTRYDHAVLGDAIEAGGFSVVRAGKQHVFRLGDDAVFEDRRVRLWDIDGDGQPEAVIVKSYLSRGAAIAVYKINENGITPFAESPAIGTRNRWLNPVGFEDFTGTGERMIAAVITPHLAGSLRLYKLSSGVLAEVARIDGFTNHIIGSRDLDLAHMMRTKDGVVIVIPTVDRRSLAVVSLKGGSSVVLKRIPVAARIMAFQRIRDGHAELRLENGQNLKISM
jgi:hypothetical protein